MCDFSRPRLCHGSKEEEAAVETLVTRTIRLAFLSPR